MQSQIIACMATTDYRPSAPLQFPHRKPPPSAPRIIAPRDAIKPLTKIVPDVAPPAVHQQTNSTFSTFPRRGGQTPASTQTYYNNAMNTTRRTPSTSTTSTMDRPSRTPSSASTALSRTASTRSGASTCPSSYVALMRKQKATVWCDRSQHEDPRMLAQQKAARARAFREISGPNMEGRTSMTGSMGSGSMGVRSKIRHHGIPKAATYSYANMVGGGVPMRLSANEVENDGLGRDDDSFRGSSHRRESGRSSMGSNQFLSVNGRQSHRYSEGSTPTDSSPNADIPEAEETPVPGKPHGSSKGDYFTQPSGNGGSGSSSEMEANFGNVGQLKAPPSARREEGKSAEELRRRGSVDERANTMGSLGGVRLFVANPDLSD